MNKNHKSKMSCIIYIHIALSFPGSTLLEFHEEEIVSFSLLTGSEVLGDLLGVPKVQSPTFYLREKALVLGSLVS